ncbi:Anti-sigma-B factor antagonist [Phycisphaerae bacterium RAS1]|nr:Anti-sigma-B factor antagonist [Phycisphaerae bacterium RAS1]
MDTRSLMVTEQEGVTLVRFRDNSILDNDTIQRIGRELGELVDSGVQRMALDFRDVRFLSSQALGVLTTLRSRAEKAQARVVLAALRPEIVRVFKITNFAKMFSFFEDADAAVRHLAQ